MKLSMEYSIKLTKSGSTDPSSSSSLATLMAPPVPLLLCVETIIAEHVLSVDQISQVFVMPALMSSKQISGNSKSIGEGLSSASTKTVHFRAIVVLPDLSSQECSTHF